MNKIKEKMMRTFQTIMKKGRDAVLACYIIVASEKL